PAGRGAGGAAVPPLAGDEAHAGVVRPRGPRGVGCRRVRRRVHHVTMRPSRRPTWPRDDGPGANIELRDGRGLDGAELLLYRGELLLQPLDLDLVHLAPLALGPQLGADGRVGPHEIGERREAVAELLERGDVPDQRVQVVLTQPGGHRVSSPPYRTAQAAGVFTSLR